MNKPTIPAGDGTRSPWSDNAGTDDSASEPNVGATGLFGTVSLPDEPPEWKPVAPPAWAAVPSQPAPAPPAWAAVPSQPAPAPPASSLPPVPPPAAPAPPAAKPLAEPVVHKVVLGGSTDESPAQLLDRIRAVTAERATTDKPAAGGQGSGGFTELLRTLGTETPVPGVKPTAPAASAALNSGFTSLLQTLNAPSKPAPVAAPPPVAPPTAWQPVAPEAPPPAFAPAAAPAPAPGGFTELLRMTGPDSSGGAGQSAPFGDLAIGGPASPSSPAPAANQPGEFTRLFGTLSASEASAPPAAPPTTRTPEPYSGGGPGSFTRMLSIEQHSAPDTPVFREEPPPSRSGMDYGLTPGSAQAGQQSPGQNIDPFFQPTAQPEPVVESTPAAGVGITRLIQMLDAPARQDAPPMPSAPAPVPTQGGPGVWTQTFASLASSAPPVAPPPSPQSWQLPAASAPSPPSSAAGPSEFTRILDASRMREQAMKGGAMPEPAAPAPQSAPMPQFQMPQPQMPAYTPPTPPPMPQVPQAPPMAGMKPPQPGGFVPPPMPGGFAAPQMPAVQAPQMPAVKAPPAPGGKLQQYVPMLLVLVAVLLVVLLVTVIFLLKK